MGTDALIQLRDMMVNPGGQRRWERKEKGAQEQEGDKREALERKANA
jgi:hypothetical protein